MVSRGPFYEQYWITTFFTDTNYGNHSDRLLGNYILQRVGGIIAYNSNTILIPRNEWNSFVNNTFYKSGIRFSVNSIRTR